VLALGENADEDGAHTGLIESAERTHQLSAPVLKAHQGDSLRIDWAEEVALVQVSEQSLELRGL
jgi:hypothetical protein